MEIPMVYPVEQKFALERDNDVFTVQIRGLSPSLWEWMVISASNQKITIDRGVRESESKARGEVSRAVEAAVNAHSSPIDALPKELRTGSFPLGH